MDAPNKTLTIIESPFSAPTHDEIVRNVYYAMLAVRDSLMRGEAPYASHLFFTQMLDDNLPEERAAGISAGFAVGRDAPVTALYLDLGLSHGMRLGAEAAEKHGRTIVERRLFGIGMELTEIEVLISEQVQLHHLPDADVVAAIYARIIKKAD